MSYIVSSLNRYFCRCLFFWFATTLGVLLTIVSFFEMVELSRRSMSHSQISFSTIAEMVVLKLPQHIEMLLPFIIFFAVVLALWRLNQTQEIISARASGVSIWQIIFGLSSLVWLIGFVHLVFINPLSAAMTARLSQLESKVFNNPSSSLAISPTGLWLKDFKNGTHSIFHARAYDFSNNRFQEVSFYQFDADGTYIGRYDAKSAFLKIGAWELKDVKYWGKENAWQDFPNIERPTDLTLNKIQESYSPPETLSFWKLPEYIDILENTGLSSIRYRLHWHSQISKLGLMISMLFLAATFCLHPIRYKNVPQLIVGGVLVGFIIHFTSDVIYALGLAEKIPIFLAAWMPSLVTLMLSITFLLHQESSE